MHRKNAPGKFVRFPAGTIYYIVGNAISYQNSREVKFADLLQSFPIEDKEDDSPQKIRIFFRKRDANFFAKHPIRPNRPLRLRKNFPAGLLFAMNASTDLTDKNLSPIFEFTLKKELILNKDDYNQCVMRGEGEYQYYNVRLIDLDEPQYQLKNAKIYFDDKRKYSKDNACCRTGCLTM